MKVLGIPGLEPVSIVEPVCERDVPAGFINSLMQARKFAGRATKVFPWLQYVYLADGKLYASDNRCIVEIDLGDPSFGPARFSAGDVSVMRAMGSNPQRVKFVDGEASFAWEAGQWCVFRGDLRGFELVERSRTLLDEFCRSGRKLSAEARTAMQDIAGRKKTGEVQRFKASVTGLSGDHFWDCGAISKVLAIAERLDTRSNLNSFTFPNGRGLIVKPSQHSI